MLKGIGSAVPNVVLLKTQKLMRNINVDKTKKRAGHTENFSSSFFSSFFSHTAKAMSSTNSAKHISGSIIQNSAKWRAV